MNTRLLFMGVNFIMQYMQASDSEKHLGVSVTLCVCMPCYYTGKHILQVQGWILILTVNRKRILSLDSSLFGMHPVSTCAGMHALMVEQTAKSLHPEAQLNTPVCLSSCTGIALALYLQSTFMGPILTKYFHGPCA